MTTVDLITLVKLAQELDMCDETGYLRQLARDGKMHGAFQVGRAWIISREDAERFKCGRGNGIDEPEE
tara:strand:- start:215 stop:418 length:204 start_codon:yes stop_codon:yes gene_type:complete